MYTIKKAFLGSFVYIQTLGRKIEVNEANKPLLLQYGLDHLLEYKPVKTETVEDDSFTKGNRKRNSSNVKRKKNAK